MLIQSLALFVVFIGISNARSETAAYRVWSHLELGAANYAETMPRSTDPEFRGPLADSQLDVLFRTVEDIVSTRGRRGTIYINDLSLNQTRFAAAKLNRYLENRGYLQIQVVEWPGDFKQILLPKVQTVHLKNPEKNLFVNGIGETLQRIANRSEAGLEITTHYEDQLIAYLHRNESRLSRRLGDGDVYPTGQTATKKRIPGRYLLPSNTVSEPTISCRAFGYI